MTILDKIVQVKEREVIDAIKALPLVDLEKACHDLPPTRPFRQNLSKSPLISLIAEIKKASPSKGLIRADFSPSETAHIYTTHGASAISVLTDTEFFQGHPAYLGEARQVSHLPLLRKDFIINPYQIYQARAWGADAVLLIAAILTPVQLKAFQSIGAELGLDCLVEVHSEEELDTVLESGACLIGINNRNLKTFVTDLETTFSLKERIPKGITVVSESGINSREDVQRLEAAGIDAILVGEALMREADIGKKVKELLGQKKT